MGGTALQATCLGPTHALLLPLSACLASRISPIHTWCAGEPRVDGEHGDLIIQLVTTKHPVFERRQSGLLAEMNITLLEALTGFTREVGAGCGVGGSEVWVVVQCMCRRIGGERVPRAVPGGELGCMQRQERTSPSLERPPL